MSPVLLLVSQFVVVVLGVLLAWLIARRRLPTPWSAIGWGVLAFPLSQVARMALLVPVTLGLTAWLGAGSPVLTQVSMVLAVLTSGLFEETTRWIVMRFWARRVRSWPQGVAFGLGHGGIEAILVIGAGMTTALVMLSMAGTITSAVATSAPEQAAAVRQQVEALRTLTAGMVALGVWERVLAVTFHVVCSLLVLRSVVSHRRALLLLAIGLHCGFNAVAVTVAGVAQPVVVELVLTACVLPLLWVVLRGPLSPSRFEVAAPRGAAATGTA